MAYLLDKKVNKEKFKKKLSFKRWFMPKLLGLSLITNCILLYILLNK